MRTLKYVLIACFLLSLTACADGSACTKVGNDGFIDGLVHGLVFPIALVAKIVGVDCELYSFSNNGLLYWIGYLIGFGGIYGGFLRFRR